MFPARSRYVITKEPLVRKRYPEALSPVVVSENPVICAKTVPLVRVGPEGEYRMLAVGLILSIRETIAVADPVFPAISS